MAHLVSLLPLFVGDALHLVQSRLLRGIVAAFSRVARLQLQLAAYLLVRLAPALVAGELCAQRRLRKRSAELENDRRELYMGVAGHEDMELTTCLLFFGLSLHCMQLTVVRVREKTTVLIMRSKADKQKKLAGGPCSRGAEKKDRPFNSNILTQRRLLRNCGFAIIFPGENFWTASLNLHRGTWLRQHSAYPLRKHHRSSLCPIP